MNSNSYVFIVLGINFAFGILFSIIHKSTKKHFYAIVSIVFFATTIPVGLIGLYFVHQNNEKINENKLNELRKKVSKNTYYDRYL